MLPRILESAGRLDIFHANAGAYVGGAVAEGDPDAWDRMLNLNVNAGFRSRPRRAAAHGRAEVRRHHRHQLDRRASCRWSGSRSTRRPNSPCRPSSIRSAARSPSTASASARSLPGPVVTALLDDWPKAKMDEALANGSLMQPEEVADAVLFMLTRPRNVVVRDLVILPNSVDL